VLNGLTKGGKRQPKFVLSLSPVRFCFARAFSFDWRTGLSFVRAGGSLEQMKAARK
jgi:hypothetical protein